MLQNRQELAWQIKLLKSQAAEHTMLRDQLLAQLPNLAPANWPIEDTVLREIGERLIQPESHDILLSEYLDKQSGTRLAGARFTYLRGPLVRTQMALVTWGMDLLSEHGFEAVLPPTMAKEAALEATGFFPEHQAEVYALPADNLYLSGTSEVPLVNLAADQIWDKEELPLRFAGYSTCYRREAGAAGKDATGLIRQHQFDKLEMVSLTAWQDSPVEAEFLLARQEDILQRLGLSYRVVQIGLNDMGNPAATKYDLEVYFPGLERYVEVTSTSNCTDYQTRRSMARYKENGKNKYLHSLNGTAIACGRILAALAEQGYDGRGRIHLPQILRNYGAPAFLETS